MKMKPDVAKDHLFIYIYIFVYTHNPIHGRKRSGLLYITQLSQYITQSLFVLQNTFRLSWVLQYVTQLLYNILLNERICHATRRVQRAQFVVIFSYNLLHNFHVSYNTLLNWRIHYTASPMRTSRCCICPTLYYSTFMCTIIYYSTYSFATRQGESDALNSSFHLSYNMLLNLLRFEGADPEFLIKR